MAGIGYGTRRDFARSNQLGEMVTNHAMTAPYCAVAASWKGPPNPAIAAGSKQVNPRCTRKIWDGGMRTLGATNFRRLGRFEDYVSRLGQRQLRADPAANTRRWAETGHWSSYPPPIAWPPAWPGGFAKPSGRGCSNDRIACVGATWLGTRRYAPSDDGSGAAQIAVCMRRVVDCVDCETEDERG